MISSKKFRILLFDENVFLEREFLILIFIHIRQFQNLPHGASQTVQ